MKHKLTALFLASLLALTAAGCSEPALPAELPASAQEPSPEAEAEEEAEEEEEENYNTGDASLDDPRNQDDIGENELLVVSFGTSYNDSRRLTIGAIEGALEEAFPDYSVRRAFTSQIIIDHVEKRDGIKIDNVEEALNRAKENGVKNLLVQPTHLMNGLEYNDLMEELAAREDDFDSISVGAPLLSTDSDFEEVAEALVIATKEYADGNTAICFMGHGTEAESNGVYAKMQELLTKRGFTDYYVGTVEAEPSLEDLLEAVKAKEYTRVVLKPMMVVAGDHANNDMAGDEEDSWKSQFEAAGYEVECLLSGLGESEEIRELYVQHAKEAEELVTEPAKNPVSDRTDIPGSELKDGEYEITVESSSSMFRIEHCTLTVKDGEMTADMTMGGTGYLYVYPGSIEDAEKADEKEYIPFEEASDGTHHFTIPVSALNAKIPCAAYSKRKEIWYDRDLVFQADSLPGDAWKSEGLTAEKKTPEIPSLKDGDYLVEVSLSGGTGRAGVESPAQLTVKNGSCTARIVFSSPNYDYMVLEDGVRLEPVNTEGNSAFEVPVPAFDTPVSVIADTTAMSKPHEIEYTLTFDSSTIKNTSNQSRKKDNTGKDHMILSYAKEFSVDYVGKDCALVKIRGIGNYLIKKKGAAVPKGIPEDAAVIETPVKNVYLASSAAGDLWRQLKALDLIRLTSTKEEDWSIPELREALQKKEILYAGKYNAPDYERILTEGCSLAVENTMIFHQPEVKEKLEKLGIPVLVDHSSYESHPFGRLEWIRLYGLITGHEEEAERFFEEQISAAERSIASSPAGKTGLFFYFNSNGTAVVRRPGDYISKMLQMTGIEPVSFTADDSENTALSTMKVQTEDFYSGGKNADILIYNSSIVGELESMGQFASLNPLLKQFKAVKSGNVWCTSQDMYQQPTALPEILKEFRQIADGTAPDRMKYLYRIRS